MELRTDGGVIIPEGSFSKQALRYVSSPKAPASVGRNRFFDSCHVGLQGHAQQDYALPPAQARRYRHHRHHSVWYCISLAFMKRFVNWARCPAKL
jgi:hypothetical protein